MARKFRGTFSVRVDGKGRMSVPARLRKVLDAGDPDFSAAGSGRTQFVLVHGDDAWKCLEIWPIAAAERLDDWIDLLVPGSRERQALERLMNGQSLEMEIDREGRLVLPLRLREKLGLSDGTEAVFESRGDYVQVYHPDAPPEPGFDPREYLRAVRPVAAPLAAADARDG